MDQETNVVLFPGVHSIEPAPVVDVIDTERDHQTAGLLGSLIFQYAITPTSEAYDDKRDLLYRQFGEVRRAAGWTEADCDRCMQAAWEALHGWAEGMGRYFGR
jgi:hypothetical protein